MTLQWKRVCDLEIGNAAAGEGLVLRGDASVATAPRIQIDIEKTVKRTVNHATIKIFNLHPDNANRIKGEFDEVLVKVGYEADPLLVFAGNIRHAYRYREGVDWITELDCGDGDFDLRNTIVNTTLGAGTTDSDALNHIVQKMERTKLGHAVLKERKRIRGRVLSGAIDKEFDKIAAESDVQWSIQDGELVMVPVDSTLPTEAIVLRSDTGLLDAPQVDDKGITATCLLNPRIRPNGKVQLDNNSFRLKVLIDHKFSATAKPKVQHTTKPKAAKKLQRLDPDGIYKVLRVVHKGDTRGDEWKTEVTCVALAKTIPADSRAA